jgi:hypothetical protein
MGDISKLPKWAQDHIAGLRREIQALQEGPVQEPTRIGVGYHMTRSGEPKFWLKSREHVTFFLEDRVEGKMRKFINVKFDERESTLYVHSSDELFVTPRSSNALQLML